jgi:signal transduction histidine kinase/CheY-like chemotaxis protein
VNYLAARALGYYTPVVPCMLVPGVGEDRFIIAGLLVFVLGPLVILVSTLQGSKSYTMTDHLLDIVTVVVIAHFAPLIWHSLLVIGICIALGTIFAARSSSRIYSLGLIVLVPGLSSAALLHDITDWHMSIIALLCTVPSTMIFARVQLKIAGKLEKRLKTQEGLRLLAGGVAHDFNNILTAISGYSELALADLTTDHPAHESVLQVIASADRAGIVSRQLLSYSGKQVFEPTKLDLGSEIRQISSLLKHSLRVGIEIVLEFDATAVIVRGDQGQLQQVFLNIVLNAVEATTPPGTILITLRHHDGEVEVIVKDTGIGIEKDKIERVFDPFYTSKPKGHGLGLAAVERIVSAHHGRIHVSSEFGLGTEITVTLPIDATPGQPARLVEPQKKGSVLVAEDESMVRSIIVHNFQSMGFNVLEAKDGTECVDLFTKHRDVIALVSLDINMPGLNGWQCLAHIRHVSTDLPVLIVSGYDPQSERISAQDGFTRYLSKPFRQQQLRAATAGLMSADGGVSL